MALFLRKPCRRMGGGSTKAPRALNIYTVCGNKWSAAHVGRFALVEMTAWRMCPRASVGAPDNKKRLEWQNYNRQHSVVEENLYIL